MEVENEQAHKAFSFSRQKPPVLMHRKELTFNTTENARLVSILLVWA